VSFVLDASVSACWALDDEEHAIADMALVRSAADEVVVPALWWFEIRNLLIVAERRGRITATKTSVFFASLERLTILIDHVPDDQAIMALARRHGLTVYDSAYLELALRTPAGMATLDKRLAAAAAHEGVSLIG
jgi:predicted nucleic acid-binding protein